MNDRELMQYALRALEASNAYDWSIVAALRERLAQPEQEPVAWMWKDGTVTADPDRADGTWTPLYTAPQPREWVGLTEEEFSHGLQMSSNTSWMKAAKWVEAKLREKNA